MSQSYHGTHTIAIPGTRKAIEAHIIITIYKEGWWAQSEEGYRRGAKYGRWVNPCDVVLGGMMCRCTDDSVCQRCYDEAMATQYAA